MSSLLSPEGIAIDWTMTSQFLSCERKFYWRFVRDLIPKRKSFSLSLGGAIHKGLEVYYSNGLKEVEALVAYTKSAQEAGLPETVAESKTEYRDKLGRSIELGALILIDYFEYYENDNIKVVQTELGISIILVAGKIVYVGKIDGLAEMGGRLYVLEHKTTSYLNARFLESFRPSFQVSGYILGTETTTSMKCQGAIINALGTSGVLEYPKEATSRIEAIGKRFGRAITTRTNAELDRDLEQIKIIGLRIIQRLETLETSEFGEFVMNPVACTSYYGCEYRYLCNCTDPGVMNSIIQGEYEKSPWIPLEHLNMAE